MARKKIKNFKIEQEELKSQTIGIFESRRKSSISIFIILTLFIGVVIFLPQISNVINAYLNPETPEVTPGHVQKPITPPTDDDTPEEEFYDLSTNPSITQETLTFDNFILDLENNTLSFKLTNSSNSSLALADLNYYLELYNSEHTLLERVKVFTTEGITSNSVLTLTKNISSETSSSLTTLMVVKKDTEYYPNVNLNNNQEGAGALVCTKDYEKVTYKFQDNKLQELTSEINYPQTTLNDFSAFNNYRTLSSEYNNTTGVVSLFSGTETSEYLNVTTNVNLAEAKRTYIFNADTFSKDTEPKVVLFEMEAQGFKCN